MASQALYRKWRSQTFKELVGQEHVVQTLRNAIGEDRVAHAYLFTGPRGVGKTSMARLLAKAVNCTAPPQERPCGICPMCQAISAGNAVDIIEMDAASHTSVDDARDLIERVQFRPTSGRYKVYVIDEVHMLSTAAFNALLKTLEEPPEHAIFILATTEIHKVPATILSRCQRFTFTRHTIAQIAAHMESIASSEGLTLEEGVAADIARAATGSMRDALGILEQLASFTSGSVSRQQVQSLLGMSAAAEVDSLIDGLLANDMQAVLRAVNSIADQGSDMRQFARDLVERLRALMLLVTTQDRSLLDVSDDDIARMEGWSAQADPAALVRWIRLLSNLDYQLRTSAYGHLPLELALVEALLAPAAPAAPPTQAAPAAPRREPDKRPDPTRSKAAARARAAAPASRPAEKPPAPQNGEHKTASTQPPASQEPPADSGADQDKDKPTGQTAPPADAPPQSALREVNAELSMLEQVEAVWPAVVRDVRPYDNKLQAMLRDAYPIDVEGNNIVLLAKYTFHKTQIEKPDSRRILEDVLSQHMGRNVGIRCINEEQTRRDDMRSQIASIRNDPHVKAARNIFEAEIIDVWAADEE
jgi:DNA polymerase-3 subunit gamma/tau